MPPRSLSLRLEDILIAVERILRYTDGMDFDRFASDEKTQDAVLRNLAVIGEAAARISQEEGESLTGLPLKQMQGMRNIIIHDYFGVSLKVVWDTVTEDLLPLLPILKRLFQEHA